MVGCLCSLQLGDCHTRKCDSVMRVDHRTKAGVMRLTEYLRRCVLGEQSMIKRKVILIGVEGSYVVANSLNFRRGNG